MAIRKDEWANLSGDETYSEYLLKARTRFEKGEAATLQEVRRVYQRAANDVRRILENTGLGGPVTRAYLQLVWQKLLEVAKSINKDSLAAIQNGITLAVDAGVEGPKQIALDLLKDSFDVRDVEGLFASINQRALLALLARTGHDGLKLSDRVWRIEQSYRRVLQALVEDGVARGLDSRKLAREVQKYLQPGVWTAHKAETRKRLGVPRDVSYEAMRLARTELNHAFHESCILASRAVPSYEGVFWRLSGSHPKPDVCDDYARHNGNGFWPKGTEPSKPHPQCYCYILPANQPPEQFTNRLKDWIKNPGNDPVLETWYNQTARRFLKRPSPASLASPAAVRESPLSKVLKNKEAEIAGLSHERAYVFDRNGNIVLKKDGARDNVAFTPEEVELIRDKNLIFTHNHPTRGGSFSLEDILFAARLNLAEMRAVGQRYEHSMVRSETGWPDIDTLVNEYRRADQDVRNEFWRRIALGQMTRDEAEREHHHQVWLRVAEKLRLIYSREER